MALMVDLRADAAGHRYAPFMFAVLVTAFLTGFGPSLVATCSRSSRPITSTTSSRYELRLDSEDIVQLAIFLSIAVCISFLSTEAAAG